MSTRRASLGGSVEGFDVVLADEAATGGAQLLVVVGEDVDGGVGRAGGSHLLTCPLQVLRSWPRL
jgi:hypothetical protein